MIDEAQTIMDEKKRLAAVPPDQQALGRGDAGGAALPADRSLRGEKRLNWKARSDEVIKAYNMSLKDGKSRR